jgi:hypothetical protein
MQDFEKPIKRKRNLPHWTYSDSVYFITWRIHEKQNDLSMPERSFIAELLHSFNHERYELSALSS